MRDNCHGSTRSDRKTASNLKASKSQRHAAQATPRLTLKNKSSWFEGVWTGNLIVADPRQNANYLFWTRPGQQHAADVWPMMFWGEELLPNGIWGASVSYHTLDGLFRVRFTVNRRKRFVTRCLSHTHTLHGTGIIILAMPTAYIGGGWKGVNVGIYYMAMKCLGYRSTSAMIVGREVFHRIWPPQGRHRLSPGEACFLAIERSLFCPTVSGRNVEECGGCWSNYDRIYLIHEPSWKPIYSYIYRIQDTFSNNHWSGGGPVCRQQCLM